MFYSQVLQRTRTMFNDFVLQGIVMHQYAMILSLLLSLRQACDHPFLLLARAKGLLKRQDDEDIGKALTTQFIDQIYNSAFQTRQSVTSYAETVLKEIQEKRSLYKLTCPVSFHWIFLHRFVVMKSDFILFSLPVFITSVRSVFMILLRLLEYDLFSYDDYSFLFVVLFVVKRIEDKIF